MNLFRRSRCNSPSFDIPKLCLPRQKRTTSIDSDGVTADTTDPLDFDAKNLKVPNSHRSRSSSFDTSSLHENKNSDNHLTVPGGASKRSRSFDASMNYRSPQTSGSSDDTSASERDSGSSLLKRAHYKRSSIDIPKFCIHCLHTEALSEINGDLDNKTISDGGHNGHTGYYSSTSEESSSCSSSDSDDGDDDGTSDEPIMATLQVPNLSKPRSSSMDVSWLQVPCDQDRRASLDLLNVPQSNRSSSVDVKLPTDEDKQYRAITHTCSKAR